VKNDHRKRSPGPGTVGPKTWECFAEALGQAKVVIGDGLFGDDRMDLPGQLELGVGTMLKVQPPFRRSVTAAVRGDDHDVGPISKAHQRRRPAPTRVPPDGREHGDLAAPPPPADAAASDTVDGDMTPGDRRAKRTNASGVGLLLHVSAFQCEPASRPSIGCWSIGPVDTRHGQTGSHVQAFVAVTRVAICMQWSAGTHAQPGRQY
jgi:hypothetical protein